MYIKLKKVLTYIFLFLFIIGSYLSIEPLKNSIIPLNKHHYDLQISNVKNNLAAEFRELSEGIFRMHPGVTKATKALFTFKYASTIKMHFTIAHGSRSGDIEFVIQKNKKKMTKFVIDVTKNKSKKFEILVKRGDSLTIIADKHGNTDYDWGQIEITQTDVLLRTENLIPPLLWILFFIFMIKNGYQYLSMYGYLVFLLYIYVEKFNFGLMTSEIVLWYQLGIFSILFLHILIWQFLNKLGYTILSFFVHFVLAIVVLIVPLLFLTYYLNFSLGVTTSVCYDILQSNQSEAYKFLMDYVQLKYFIMFGTFVGLVFSLIYMQITKTVKNIDVILILFVSVTFIVLIVFNKHNFRIYNFLNTSYSKYIAQINNTKWIQNQRSTGKISFHAKKEATSETYIVVIGESENKKHMGAYGYFRDTTPNLSKLKLNHSILLFDNAYSSHIKTMHTLKYALTEKNQYNTKSYNDSLSIIDVLNKADVKTYWLTNQPLYGPMDNIVTVLAKSASIFKSTNAREKYDSALVTKVEKILNEKTTKNRVIFVHMYGNHSTYSHRYPHTKKYSQFSGKLDSGEFGKDASENKDINSYDNSVKYVDEIVGNILGLLQKHTGVSSLFYMSDHSEDVIGFNGRKFGHPAPIYFNFDMVQIPMFAWFSKDYQERYSDKYSNLLKHEHTIFTNDLLYDTLVGICGIKTKLYTPKYDLSSAKYALPVEDALTLYKESTDIGKLFDYKPKHFLDKTNYIYWQKHNIHSVSELHSAVKIVVSDVNNIGKLNDVWNDGLKTFDVKLQYNKSDDRFYIVHKNKVTHTKFTKYLSTVPIHNLSTGLIEIINLNSSNMVSCLARLNSINTRYKIKAKSILKIKTNIKCADWDTVYRVDFNEAEILEVEKDEKKLHVFTHAIINKLDRYNSTNIIFNAKYYTFFKKYIEPLLHRDYNYNIEDVMSINTIGFNNELKKNKIFLDKNVKLITVMYQTKFI